MNFLVARSGIYYFRKTFQLPGGRRKEIRRSLKTRDKQLAQYLALKMLYEKYTAPQAIPIEPSFSADAATALIPVPAAPTSPVVPIPPKKAPSAPKPVSIKLDKAIELFVTEKARSGSWKERENSRVGNMLNALVEVLGAVPVNKVGKAEAAKFKDSLLNSKRSITTINNYLKRASMLFDWLDKREDGVSNPFKGLTIKQKRQPSSFRAAYTEEGKKAYLEFAQRLPEWRKWILLLLRYTGARPNEICQLYRDDVDLEEGVIHIRQGRPDQSLKTLSSCRAIPIHSKLLSAGFGQFVSSMQGRLFPALKLIKGTYSHSFITWFSKQRAKWSSLPELYGARHTAATEMKSAGVPEQYAAAVLGHANGSITYDRYGKGMEHRILREAVEVIGRLTTEN